jgi:uncharacterized membrane protein YhaH (DUF805 family)
MRLLRLWFSLSTDVGRLVYSATGLALMAAKYAVEAALIHHFTGRFFAPHDFLNPLLTMRQQFLAPPAPDWLAWAFFAWTLPFLWIAVSMSVRRAANSGATAWLGLLVLVPFMNFIIMVVLCLLPPKPAFTWSGRRLPPRVDHQLKSALLGIAASLGISLVMVGVGVYALKEYGATLFLGTPILMGATSAFIYNRPYPRGLGRSLIVAELSIVLSGLAILLFAFEGIICLAMLFPIAGGMGLLGGLVGYAMGALTASRGTNLTFVLVFLPLLAGAESLRRPTPLYEVVTTIDIDAPPQQVWPHVIGFSELPAPDPWYFKLGIAYPQRATIEGSGVGAVRRCEFSTGAFVEPITIWDPPRRLAFNVASQPPPMHELSPYRHVHPPHLDGYLRCQRGEFRLIPLPDGRTRLEGSTWYEFEMYPQDYWTLWSDACIHRIHLRVLKHIKRLSEVGPTRQHTTPAATD